VDLPIYRASPAGQGVADHGRPLVSHEVIVNLIAAVTTRTGLKIRAELDRGTYPPGMKATEAEYQTLHLKPQAFHSDWNYALLRKRKTK
jgi:Rhodopirellula transposase DDE domain